MGFEKVISIAMFYRKLTSKNFMILEKRGTNEREKKNKIGLYCLR